MASKNWALLSFASTNDRSETGAVLVFVCVILTTLLSLTAFVVDIANWYLHAERYQRAADAAALAGAVYTRRPR